MGTQAFKRIGLLCLAGSMLSGCMMYRLEELRRTAPSGDAFQTKLSRMYLRFAEQEEAAYDWKDSWHFADKGLMLAYGNDVPPEEVEDWHLDPDSELELQKARIRVMDLLTPHLKKSNPEQAAAIQFYFDCWIEQQEENWQEDDIAECRNGLLNALGGHVSMNREVQLHHADDDTYSAHAVRHVEKQEMPKPVATKRMPVKEEIPFGKPTPPSKTSMITAEAEPEVAAKKAAPEPFISAKVPAKPTQTKEPAEPANKTVMPKGKQQMMEPSVETASYAVFFEQKKPEISTPGKNVLKEVTDMLKGSLDYSVILHVAKQPSADVSPELSRERIVAVRKALESGGVRGDAIYDDSEAERAKSASKRIELFLNE